jgi:hypothetical protein
MIKSPLLECRRNYHTGISWIMPVAASDLPDVEVQDSSRDAPCRGHAFLTFSFHGHDNQFDIKRDVTRHKLVQKPNVTGDVL